MLLVRALIFYSILGCLAFFYGLLSLVLSVTPYSFRSRVLITNNKILLWVLKVVCGVRYEVRGLENLPRDTPVVIMAKHQSTWESFFLQSYFHPISIILKRELLRIPFFGWGLAQLRPIAIDRSNPRDALKKVKQLGSQRLAQGNHVLVFPEGTRTPVGQVGNYARSGADIALSSQAPLIPIAHNAGVYWPMHSLKKQPGTIIVSIGPAIDTQGKTSKVLITEVKDWIESEVDRLPKKI